MEILTAQPNDAYLLAPLFDNYRQFYNKQSDIPAAEVFLAERLSNKESEIFYARKNNEQLGFVQLYPSFSSIALKRIWILNDLFVLPEARRHGIAKNLLVYCAEFAKATQARGLTLKTGIDNTAAQALYESLGWKSNTAFGSYDLIIDKVFQF